MANEMIWKKASRCGTGNCVEVASRGDGIVVRDSGDPQGPELAFSKNAWTGFRAALHEGKLTR